MTAGDPEDEDAPEPMRAALPNKEAFQHIRAVPAMPGDAILFTHRIIHWGSAGSKRAAAARVSISFGCSDPLFEVRIDIFALLQTWNVFLRKLVLLGY
jgi:ectoine hydroxylase-related dioxygenase (phytanoyl-CoA dioxygenase family)